MIRVLFTGTLMILFCGVVFAQSPAGPGRAPFGSYFTADIDTVNLYNGNLMLDIPVFSRSGRELSTSLRMVYNAQGWTPTTTPWATYGTYQGGFRTAGQPTGTGAATAYLADCDYSLWPFVPPSGTYAFDVYWIDETGAVHQYYAPTVYQSGDYGGGGCDGLTQDNWNAMGTVWLGSGSYSDTSMARMGSGDMRIRLGDGTMISPGSRVETRNGNYANVVGATGLLEDTLGRTISGTYTSGSGTYTFAYTVHDAEGVARDYTLHYVTCHTVYNPFENTSQCLTVLSSIELPNGRSYDFEYAHDQGFLTKVTLPTGGYIAFDYYGGNSDHNADDNYIVQRRVSADGTTEGSPWTYDRADSGTTRTVTVTDPEGHQIVHVFGYGSTYETETRWLENSTADPTKVVQTGYAYEQPSTVVTQIGNVKQQQTFTWWAGSVPYESTQSDWYTGSTAAPLTKTAYTYPNYSTPPNYFPTQVELKQWNGSTYVTQGKTQYEYDEFSLTSTSGSVPNYVSPGSTPRHNITTVRRYSDASNYLEEHFHYDDVGNVVEHVDERGKSTTFDFTDNYSNSGYNGSTYAYPKQVTDALSHHIATTVYSFDTGLPLSVTDARGKTTTMTYDLLNRPLTISGPITNSGTSYSYDDSTPKVTESVLVATGKSRTTETTIDKLGRPIQTKSSDPDGDVYVNTEYDGNGQVQRVSEPYRNGTPVFIQTDHDVLGRPVTVTNPDSSYTTYSYLDNTVTQTDEAGNPRRYTSNTLGQLTKVEEPNPNLSSPLVTDYSYYVFGPLYQVTQTGSLSRTFTADWLGRVISEDHPENGNTSYTYDGSLIVSRMDARSITTDYVYDDIGRLQTITYSDSTPDVTYSYDASTYTGLLTSVSVDGVTSSSFTYDDIGQLLSEAVTHNGVSGTFTSEYTYDLGGRLLTAKYPSGRVVTQTYAASGSTAGDRLASLTDGPTSATLLQVTQDNAAGMITNRTLSSGITETRSFNPRNQLTRISAAANSTTLLDLGYGYGTNNNGKIRARTDAVQPEHSTSYSFDPIGRLTEVSGGDLAWSIAYDIDAYGNRLHQTPSGLASTSLATTNIGYSNNKNNDPSLSYDAAGNFTFDGTFHYYFDAENRIYQVGSSSIQYAYDHAGRRIKKLAGGVTTFYFYGLTGLMSEFSTSTSLSSVTAATSSDRIQYRVGEQTGTALMLVAADGTARENNRVFPFGEPWNAIAGSDNAEKFTTYQHDGETDLDYAMARNYASRSGRFLSPDPGHVGADLVDPQSWDAYSYALNDPIDFVDRNGKWPWSIHYSLIDEAFPYLTKQQRALLKYVSDNQDLILTGGQSAYFDYQHALCKPGQKPSEGIAAYQNYVSENEAMATKIQSTVKPNKSGIKPLNNYALMAFGKALHAVLDNDSPTHAGCQEWALIRGKENLAHIRGESTITKEQREQAVKDAQQAFNRTFGNSGASLGFNEFDMQRLFWSSLPEVLPKGHATVTIIPGSVVDK